jgi:predicted DNA-binding transcriptional regulator AlpA
MSNSNQPKKLVYTVDEYCHAHGICRATAYNLWRRGKGPKRMRIGERWFVSVEAAEEYRRQQGDLAVAAE